MGRTVAQIGMIVGTAILTGGISATAPFFIASATKVIIGATIIAGSVALAPKPKLRNSSLQQRSFEQQSTNRSLMVRQPIIARSTVYGLTKKSGGILFMETTNNNKELHIIVEVASHEIQSFQRVYFNDEELTLSSDGNDANGISRQSITSPSRFASTSTFDESRKAVRIKLHTGSDDQLADADLVSESSNWTNEHRLRGIAYIYAKLDYNPDMFPNGIPNISAEIQGKKVLDFRTGSTSFSSNPALCIFDYLTDTRYGLGVSTNNIDTDTFTTMANLADQNITLSGGGTEKKYTLNGILYNDIAPMEILDDMLTSCLGIITYTNGKFKIKGGQFVSPTITLTEDDFVTGLTVNSKHSRRTLFNTVKGVFTSSESNWQPSDYPMVTSSTFVTEDNDETIFADIDLPYTTSSATAQRIAKICLFKNRQQITLSGSMKLTAFKLEVGDTVSITNSRLGFSSKVFEVAEYLFQCSPDGVSVTVSLKETASSVYDWNAEESEFISDNTTLPSSATVSTPSLSVSDELRTYSETPITILVATVTSNQGTTNEFEVQYRNKTLSEEFKSLGRSKGNEFEVVNVQDGADYEVRARAINAFNVHSDFVTLTHQVVGKTAPPSDVTNFSVNVINGMAELSWTPISDLDLSHYVVRHTPNTTSATFEQGTIIAEKVSKPASTLSVPARTGTYMIKSIDVLGIESINTTKSAVILNNIDYNFNAVVTQAESPSFSGTKSDLTIIERTGVNRLELLLGELFDDATGLFDSQTGNFDDGGTTTDNVEGTYDFPVIDLGNIFTSRITVNLAFSRIDPTTLFDSFSGLFDARDGLFDGAYTEFNDVNVEILISLSNDNSTYTDFRNYVLGDYKARYIKLRAKLTTQTLTATPSIETLSVTVDMPDRSVAESDISSGTSSSGKVITFSPAFKSLQGLGITAQNLEQNEHYQISNKTANGFTITFYQGTGTGSVVSRSFDYVAKGFGRVESS